MQMIHVDVKTHTIDKQSSFESYECVIVEVSNDGAPWFRLATFPIYKDTTDMNATQQKSAAEQFARAWINGARYAGGAVRGTSHGYTL